MTLSKKLKKLLIWCTGYASLVAFCLTGGYFFLKDDDVEIKATCKETTYFCLTFFFIDLINLIIKKFILLVTSVPSGFVIYLGIVSIFKILIFITLLILDLLEINLIHTPVGVRVQTDNVIIPSIKEEEFLETNQEYEEDDEDRLDNDEDEEYVDEDGNIYQSNIFN